MVIKRLTIAAAIFTCTCINTALTAQDASTSTLSTAVQLTNPMDTALTATETTMPVADPPSTGSLESTAGKPPEMTKPGPSTTSSLSTNTSSTVEIDDRTSVTTPEGVSYEVLKPGTGPVEQSTQTLLLHYTLFLPGGKKLESSRDAEFPMPLKLQRNTDSFIRGFEIGTKGMRIGEVRRIYIPAEMGYGEKGTEAVPPNSPLIFETELVDLK